MAIGYQAKRNQRLYVGTAKTLVPGLGPGGVKVAPNRDHGSVTGGVQGDSVLSVNAVSDYTMTVELLQESTGIALILGLRESVGFFPVSYQLGAYEINGFAVVMNEGEASGAEADTVRTITLAVAKQKGGLTGIGTPIAP